MIRLGGRRLPIRGMTDVYHHVVCRQQVEVEVWPAEVTINFQDERYANPINTQIRFEAMVYNSRYGILWEVRDPAGNPGLGTIDATGLYQAPPKGSLASGTTEMVVATAWEDRLRRAFAWVTLVGEGPAPAPRPSIDIWPKRATIYYPNGADNQYIDECNNQVLFHATAYNNPGAAIQWLINGTVEPGTDPWLYYRLTNTGPINIVTVQARFQSDPTIYDEAKLIELNYDWPGV